VYVKRNVERKQSYTKGSKQRMGALHLRCCVRHGCQPRSLLSSFFALRELGRNGEEEEEEERRKKKKKKMMKKGFEGFS
jgi:hypothetical protein